MRERAEWMPQVSAAALVLRPAFVNFARVAHRVHRRETRFCCPALDSSLFIFHKFTKSVNILKTFLPHCSHLAVWSRVCPCSSWVQPRDHPTILLLYIIIISKGPEEGTRCSVTQWRLHLPEASTLAASAGRATATGGSPGSGAVPAEGARSMSAFGGGS